MKNVTLVLGASTNPNRYSNIAIKRLIDNPSFAEDLGERLYETVYPRYTLKTVTTERAQWYRELITKA